jgi:hypothetical protein
MATLTTTPTTTSTTISITIPTTMLKKNHAIYKATPTNSFYDGLYTLKNNIIVSISFHHLARSSLPNIFICKTWEAMIIQEKTMIQCTHLYKLKMTKDHVMGKQHFLFFLLSLISYWPKNGFCWLLSTACRVPPYKLKLDCPFVPNYWKHIDKVKILSICFQ